MRVLGVIAVVALVAVVVGMFVRAGRRDRGGTSGSFWPQSAGGQVVAVLLAIFVVGALISFAV